MDFYSVLKQKFRIVYPEFFEKFLKESLLNHKSIRKNRIFFYHYYAILYSI